jgi:transposase
MTKQTRRKFSAELKAKAALEAIKNQKTLAQLSQQYEINPIIISKCHSALLHNVTLVSQVQRHNLAKLASATKAIFYAQLSHLKVVNVFFQKFVKIMNTAAQMEAITTNHQNFTSRYKTS